MFRMTALAAAAALALAAAGLAPVRAVTVQQETVVVAGTPGADYGSVINLYTRDTSGIERMTTAYTWDNYLHIDALPAGNTVFIWQSWTCQNLGPCSDSITPTGPWGDAPGYKFQPHVSIHHNSVLTFWPSGSGHTLTDAHYEHGSIPWIVFSFRDGLQIKLQLISPGYTQSFEPLDAQGQPLPHLNEVYVLRTTALDSARYVTDSS